MHSGNGKQKAKGKKQNAYEDEILNSADCCEPPKQSLQNDVWGDADCDEDCDQMLKNDANNASMPLDPFASSHHLALFPFLISLPAFSLAEVLITLGIIGIVAAMTIPTLIQNTRDQQTVVAVKKAYSVLSSAFTSAVQENGTADNWDLGVAGTSDGATKLMDIITPSFSIAKNCGTQNGCFANGLYKTINGYDAINFFDDPHFAKVQLNDGSTMATWSNGQTCGGGPYCGFIVVDINGNKSPNKYGIDTFWFMVASTKITPYGYWGSSMAECNKFDSAKNGNNGRNCTNWILFNNNMDYTHCELTNWATQHSCP